MRINRPADYKRILTTGNRVRSGQGLFDLKSLPNGGASARLGQVVPKRLTPLAVGRNLVKRLIRESFRHSCQDLPALDIVVRQIAKMKDPDGANVRKELDALFSRVANG